jgi:alpha-L-arabinofuranosidase
MEDSGVTRRTVLRGTALGVLGAAALTGAKETAARADPAPLTLTVDTASPGHAVSPQLYGAFFEEINYAGVGGLYAELIRNRAFMDPATPNEFVAPANIPRVPGVFGSALQLNGGSPASYVLLPPGIVSGLTDFTVAVWVNPAATPNWSRAWDFGTGETAYMFLTVSAGGTSNPRFAITVSGNGNEQRLDAPGPLPLSTWTHLAVTLSGTTGTLYVNGVAVATNTSMTLNPSSLPVTTNDYVGKSQFPPDPALDATVDEFQIWNTALSAAQVQSLLTSAAGTTGGGNVVWYRFDEAAGATAVDSSGNGRGGTIELIGTDWTAVADGGAQASATLDATTPLNDQLTRSLRLELTSVTAGQRAGMANAGYFGVPAVPGQVYRVSFFAKATTESGADFDVPLTLSLESSDGSAVYAEAQVHGLTAAWRRFDTTLRVPRGATATAGARFVISVDNRGPRPVSGPDGATVWLQVVSVFPPTGKNRRNGLRPDLTDIVAAIHPKVLRFPGGNYVEGVTVDTRWDWKQTIGPIWERPGHENSAWGYWSDDGLGLLEFLELAEELGATPVIGVWAGLTLDGTVIAQDELAPYVQDALDLVEYVTGPVTSPWGARRAADGHPHPFRIPYLEIGNEDFLNGGTASYDAYRYPMFYDALKGAYPQVPLVATSSVTSRPMDVLDLHFYSDAAFFEQASTMFDSYSRGGPLIFVGEYSATANAGALPTGLLGNSVGEAAFMTGLERNSDIVHMSSYAPLFANYNHTQWDPDLIGFDQVQSFGSTSYWVQRMFATNVGDRVLPVTASASGLYYSATIDSRCGRVYLKVVNPAAQALTVQLTFGASTASAATIEVLTGDPTSGNTLADPDAIMPARSALRGSGGVFSYQAPASSVTVVTVP